MADDRFSGSDADDGTDAEDRSDRQSASDSDPDFDFGLPFGFMNNPSATGRPSWLSEFEDLANRELGTGSACEQVHPHVAAWYQKAHEAGPLASRDSIEQAMACLSTEVLNSIPDGLFEKLMEIVDEDTLAAWVEYVLYIGRAFERSLNQGDFDDL